MPQAAIRYLNKNFDEAAIMACLADMAFEPGFQIGAENQSIVAALRRASEEFRYASIDEMSSLLADYSDSQIAGLVSNIKGIAFEMEFVQLENEDGDGVFANLYPDTNNPGFDVQIFDEATGESWPLQLKATNDVGYVNDWIEDHPDREIQVTDEIAEKLGLDPTGIDNEGLTARTQDVVDQIVAFGDESSLASYFPALSAAFPNTEVKIQQTDLLFFNEPLNMKGSLQHQKLEKWHGKIELNGPLHARLAGSIKESPGFRSPCAIESKPLALIVPFLLPPASCLQASHSLPTS